MKTTSCHFAPLSLTLGMTSKRLTGACKTQHDGSLPPLQLHLLPSPAASPLLTKLQAYLACCESLEHATLGTAAKAFCSPIPQLGTTLSDASNAWLFS